jgi:hypothetical protein
MLSGFDMQIGAFGPEDEAGANYCRGCTVKRFAEITVGRLEAGLSTGTGWMAINRYQLAEEATFNGYEFSPGGSDDFDESYAEVTCFDCGTRLDEYDDEPVGALAT